ncbi:hypothetical protein EG347_19030 [Chryseobacterium sp. G0186]|uniref:hypothetical protein n=1 Tax=Chryseobacterium sp. G0186 TaxID=2487064 RepID=UPI000F4F2EC5|nr:hypothetical protein [Chryseobacterium sp. G0186]AZA79445.1 hypothetical protein EG347_19030 [Chryseobacterium sp. G0186]
MENFIHLKKENDGYWVKQYISLPQILMMLWVFISIIVIIYSSHLKTGVVLLILSLIMTVLSFIPPKICFDPVSQRLIVKNTGLSKREVIYDLTEFEGFELQTFRYGFIHLGCYLYANFKNVSGLKRPVVSQSFRKKTMQEVANELEDLRKHIY